MVIPEIYCSPCRHRRKATLFTGLNPLYLSSLSQCGEHQTSSAITPGTTKIIMNWLFPKETSRYITMLREPTQHFESIFNFFHLGKRFLKLGNVSTSPLETFLQNSTSHLEHLDPKQTNSSINLIRNPALFELGLDAKYHSNSTVVRNYIRFLQKEFDLVIITPLSR